MLTIHFLLFIGYKDVLELCEPTLKATDIHLPCANVGQETNLDISSSSMPLADLLKDVNFNLLISLTRALNLVPAEFKLHRFQFISDVINTELKTNFSVEETMNFAQSIEGLPCAIHELPCNDVLWKVSLSKGIGCMRFLAPPTLNCLKCGSMLYNHNKIVTVICFELEGPLLASKITLRCLSCQINYRYVN